MSRQNTMTAIEEEVFIWLFEKYMFDCIRAKDRVIELTFCCEDKVVKKKHDFAWWYEVNNEVESDKVVHLKDVFFSSIFRAKASECLAYWNYDCDTLSKDEEGLRFSLRAELI